MDVCIATPTCSLWSYRPNATFPTPRLSVEKGFCRSRNITTCARLHTVRVPYLDLMTYATRSRFAIVLLPQTTRHEILIWHLPPPVCALLTPPSLPPSCWLACKVTPANHVSFRFYFEGGNSDLAVYKRPSVGFFYQCVCLPRFVLWRAGICFDSVAWQWPSRENSTLTAAGLGLKRMPLPPDRALSALCGAEPQDPTLRQVT